MAIWFSDMELSVLVRQDRPAGAENLTAGAPSEQKSSAGDCVGDAEKSFWRTETVSCRSALAAASFGSTRVGSLGLRPRRAAASATPSEQRAVTGTEVVRCTSWQAETKRDWTAKRSVARCRRDTLSV